MDIVISNIIAPQSTRYRFDGPAPQRIGDVARIIVEGDNSFKPWHTRLLPRTRMVILLADPSGRQWLVEYSK